MSAAAAVLPVIWAKTPLRLDTLTGLTPVEERIWNRINSAVQIRTRGGRISVPELARFAECSERTVYRVLRRLKDAGYVYAVGSPGKASVYYLRWTYAGATPTPDTPVKPPTRTLTAVTTPTPDTGGRGRINNARASVQTTPEDRKSSVVRASDKSEQAVSDDARVLEQAVPTGIGQAIMPHMAHQLARQYPSKQIKAAIEWAYAKAVDWRGSLNLAGLIVRAVREGYALPPPLTQPCFSEFGRCLVCGAGRESCPGHRPT
jgi:hypothetical protein